MKNFKSIKAGLYTAVAALGMTAGSALAMPITVPTSLNVGDQYRLAFVTSTTRDGTSSNIADYNAFVTTAAASLSALGTTWTAIASTAATSATPAVDARINTSTLPNFAGGSLGLPIFLLNDTKFVDSNDDLWDGTVDVALNILVNGSATSASVNTGTNSDGTANAIEALGSPNPGLVLGNTGQIDDDWIVDAIGFKTTARRFYALSGVLTVPPPPQIPEPGTLALFGLGLLGLGFVRRKRAV